MSLSTVFGIIGGDERQIYLAKSIRDDGYSVLIGSLEKADISCEFENIFLDELSERCTDFILPLPITRDGKILNAPFSEKKISLDDSFARLFSFGKIYGGIVDKLYQTSLQWKNNNLVDYYDCEELIFGNAMLTAEGAVSIAIKEFEGALCGSSCLIMGYGRIGKALCRMLHSLGVKVDCTARKNIDLLGIKTLGCTPLRYDEILKSYDIIFNTVPNIVLKTSQLLKQSKNTLIIELASSPGGVDRHTAEKMGIKIIDAQSLPGRFSPKASGEFIKEAIYNIMEEK